MQLNVSGGEGRLLIDAAKAKELRAEFIAEAAHDAERACVEPRPREAFKRAGSTYEVWRGMRWNVRQGLVDACPEWLDPLLGFERFVVAMGQRPDGCGCKRLNDTQPWGPGNAAWMPKVKTERIPIPAVVIEMWQARARELAAEHGLDLSHFSRSNKNPLYVKWRSMLSRCNDSRTNGYHNYGGRDIKVYDEWDDSCTYGFENWVTYLLTTPGLGLRPTKRHTLDRINVNGDYEPGNIRWAPPKVQAQNKRPKGDPGTPGRRARELQELILKLQNEQYEAA